MTMPTYTPGRYRAGILDQGFDETAKGTPYFFLQLRVLSRTDAGKPADCPQLERTYRQYLSHEVGHRILRDDLGALGVEVDDLTRLDLASPDPVKLIGREIDVVCDHEIYNGRTVERWRIARPARRKLSPDQVRALGARFAAGRTRTNPATPPSPPTPPADNTPF
jgi:hypothetical protein